MDIAAVKASIIMICDAKSSMDDENEILVYRVLKCSSKLYNGVHVFNLFFSACTVSTYGYFLSQIDDRILGLIKCVCFYTEIN